MNINLADDRMKLMILESIDNRLRPRAMTMRLPDFDPQAFLCLWLAPLICFGLAGALLAWGFR